MRLETRPIEAWPPLAWLAICSRRDARVLLLHGKRVEAREDFACEAVWPGRFEEGAFDSAAVVAGSGVRVRGEEVVFVPSASTIERLHFVERPDGPLVSNSLPCLLCALGSGALFDRWRYHLDLDSIMRGLNGYRRALPVTTGHVCLAYFRNLVWTDGALVERDKPLEPPGFRGFEDYRDFLRSAMAGMARNMASPFRDHPLSWLGTVSSGYDGTAVTALGAEAGCEEAICFDVSRTNEPDSGVPIAGALGLRPLEVARATWYRRAREHDPLPEVPFLAATPTGELAPFAAARDHLSGRVLLTGFFGDGIWRPTREDTGPDITRKKTTSGMGFAEFRLAAGFIHCPAAFWVGRQIADVVAISRSAEMRPWIVGDHYQRPIARRIAEEAGVPRELFGLRKQPGVGSSLLDEAEFLGPESMIDYRRWLRRKVVRLGRAKLLASVGLDGLARVAAPSAQLAAGTARTADELVARPFARELRRRAEAMEARMAPLRDGLAVRMYPFQWGLDRATERYAQGLGEIGSTGGGGPLDGPACGAGH